MSLKPKNLLAEAALVLSTATKETNEDLTRRHKQGLETVRRVDGGPHFKCLNCGYHSPKKFSVCPNCRLKYKKAKRRT